MSIRDNVKRVQDCIAASCARVDRDPASIMLVAVSKQKTVGQIIEAVDAGLRHFGENRVEEGVEKIPQVKASARGKITWHMVGHVQSRKAKQVVQRFDIVQSVDSLKLARRLSRFALESDRVLGAHLEINISGEASKYGLAGYNWYRDNSVKANLWRAVSEIVALPNIEVRGLMTMAPYGAEEKAIRRVFADLRDLRDELTREKELPLPELSMGMTDDYQIAIEEGATMIRIGRALFGERV
ncbi:MAG: YggS family pyridoxal phosphate-dependent enzyme [Chloroflexi bacterium]|nr:YggS family pyridoxal phosphate-dependent enzyme [Chloroflexota bacterium]